MARWLAPAGLCRARGVNVCTGISLCSCSVFTNLTNQAPRLLPASSKLQCSLKCKYEPGESVRDVKGSDWKKDSRMEPSAVVPHAHRYV